MSSAPDPASTAKCTLPQGQHGTAGGTDFDGTARPSSSSPKLQHPENANTPEVDHKTSVSAITYSINTLDTVYPPPQAIHSAQNDSEHIEDISEGNPALVTSYEELFASGGFVSAKPWIDTILLAIYGPTITRLERTPQRDRAIVGIYMDHLLEKWSESSEDNEKKLFEFLNFHSPKVDDNVIAHTILTLTSAYNSGHACSTAVDDRNTKDTIDHLSRLSINSNTNEDADKPTTTGRAVPPLVADLLSDIATFRLQHGGEDSEAAWDAHFWPLLLNNGKYALLYPLLEGVVCHPQVRDLEQTKKHPESFATTDGFHRRQILFREYIDTVLAMEDGDCDKTSGLVVESEEERARIARVYPSDDPAIDINAITNMRERMLESGQWRINPWYLGRKYCPDPSCPFIPPLLRGFLEEIDKFGFACGFDAPSEEWNTQFRPLLFGGKYDDVRKWMDVTICHNPDLVSLVWVPHEVTENDYTGFKRSKFLMGRYMEAIFWRNGCEADGEPNDEQSEEQKARLRELFDVSNPVVDGEAIEEVRERFVECGCWKIES
ncbi:hypothetical protein LTR70_009967 [Exophiala xenobiotica]|uniref:Uncharacterized protein n=1 Tax=Lithohypha guttulata TaxID=1690604 RepID=A0ABR0K0K2_9EURO|nr:hypothetical protein LTR24_008351 [Lithohypha guttulata]KAK5309823.1 hypothetical protein LTR70_009967 [Exophiala xenobiotica]